MSDFNASCVMAWVHNLTAPLVVIMKLQGGEDFVSPDFEALNEADERYSIIEGTIFHYWNTNEDLSWNKFFLTLFIDYFTMVISLGVIITIPM